MLFLRNRGQHSALNPNFGQMSDATHLKCSVPLVHSKARFDNESNMQKNNELGGVHNNHANNDNTQASVPTTKSARTCTCDAAETTHRSNTDKGLKGVPMHSDYFTHAVSNNVHRLAAGKRTHAKAPI